MSEYSLRRDWRDQIRRKLLKTGLKWPKMAQKCPFFAQISPKFRPNLTLFLIHVYCCNMYQVDGPTALYMGLYGLNFVFQGWWEEMSHASRA
jgi:hypothetical protein